MPTPRANETEQEFIARCVIDPEAVADFPDTDQRLAFCYSQYERREQKKLTLKQFDKDKYQRAFEGQLDIVERRNIAKVKRYYRENYNKGIESFLGNNQTNFDLTFPKEELLKIYSHLYSDIGMHFAKWYTINYDKYLKKNFDPSRYALQWQASFAALGSSMGAARVTLVRGTALNTLQRITRGLMSDPEFMSLGTNQKATILRRQFSTYTQYQAERLVRTESTLAANFASGEASKSIFPEGSRMKEWIASFDDRTRDTHAEAGAGEPIKENEAFMVGGNMMMYPGDPAGGAAEVINCRCSVAYFPAEVIGVQGDYTDIGFGIGGGSFTDIGDGLNIAQGVGSIITESVVSATARVATSLSGAKKMIKELFEEQGWVINKARFSNKISLAEYNARIKGLDDLFKKYNFNQTGNFENAIDISFKSTKSAYGFVKYNGINGHLRTINLGDITDSWASRQRIIDTTKFINRYKSAVDEINASISTTIHEMGHTLSRSSLRGQNAFFDELKQIRLQYRREIQKHLDDNNYKAFNEVFLGRYAGSNIDEFLAESFTEYILHSNPSKYARLVGQLIDKYYLR